MTWSIVPWVVVLILAIDAVVLVAVVLRMRARLRAGRRLLFIWRHRGQPNIALDTELEFATDMWLETGSP